MNIDVEFTLDEAVAEVLGLLTGLDLAHVPEQNRYRAVTRQLNRALRANALENEWSCYASTFSLGNVFEGDRSARLPVNQRPRITGDDAVLLVNSEGAPQCWAYFLPRDALHKYSDRAGLWCSVVRQALLFSRPISKEESGLEVLVPTMREPRMFRLPPTEKAVPTSVRRQLIDFPYPDVVVARAAFFYAQSDPVMQPRVQTLEEGYKDVMYQLIERDTSFTDTPYQNAYILPLENGLMPEFVAHRHPHST